MESINLINYKTKPLVFTIVIIALISDYCLSFFWELEVVRVVAPVMGIIGITLVLYDKFLWKYPLLSFLVKIPNLNGEYKGKITYFFADQNEEKNCVLKIEQTASNIKVTAIFNKEGENPTKSASKEAIFSFDSNGKCSLLLYYENIGSSKGGDSLDQHCGLNKFEITQTKDYIKLEGFYFTNRIIQTKGHIIVTNK